jgi:glycosyltransferase involved in cell wall biosynthesis
MVPRDVVRRLLLLGYYFPPIGGAGAQRNTKLVRYLPELGWELTVVTGPGSPDFRWTPVDHAMLDEIREGARVVRVPGPEPRRDHVWRERTERWLWVKSRWQRWWEHAVASAIEEVGAQVDLVYASLAPFTTATSALRLARALRKPLVLDLEDPWALDEMLIYPTALHRRLDIARMRRTLRAADGIVMNTPEAAARVRERFPEIACVPVVAIPNGYDAEDFQGAPSSKASGIFQIVHTGSLHTDLGLRHRELRGVRRLLGGATPGVDLLTRSHVYLVQALNLLLADRPELERRIELHLVGPLTKADREVVDGAAYVREHGFLSHREAIRMIRSADLLFLPMHDVPPGRPVSIVPCKTYEYLASGRPILAAVPDGDARDLLAESGNASICRPTDVSAMRLAVEEAVSRYERGLAPPAPSSALLERLERRRLTRDLAAFVEEVVEATSSGSESRTELTSSRPNTTNEDATR